MVTFKHSSAQPIRTRLKKYLPFFIIALVVLSQLERVVRVGTIFGFQVREVKDSRVTSRQNKSGTILGADVAKKNQKSVACDIFSEEKIKEAVNTSVKKVGSFVPDRKDPYLSSSCVYTFSDKEQPFRSINILYRKMADAQVAQKTMKAFESIEKIETVQDLGDQAFYNKNTNQLTVRKGEILITVTIPKNSQANADSKTPAIAIAKISL